MCVWEDYEMLKVNYSVFAVLTYFKSSKLLPKASFDLMFPFSHVVIYYMKYTDW